MTTATNERILKDGTVVGAYPPRGSTFGVRTGINGAKPLTAWSAKRQDFIDSLERCRAEREAMAALGSGS